MKAFTDKQCLDTALRLLGRRDHSCLELSQKLKQRGFAPEMIASVIATCVKMNYLNDKRFCETYTNQLRRRGYGVMRIGQKLKAKGISAAHIRCSIERYCAEAAQRDDCQRVIEKKMSAHQTNEPPEKARARLFRFLYHRGFSSDIIRQVLQAAPGLKNDDSI